MTIVNAAVTRLGRVASVALAIAAVCGVALVVAGLVLPMYETTTEPSSGEVGHDTATLVAVNGPGVVVVLLVPLLITLAVGSALWQGARRGAVVVAWTFAGLLAAFNVVSMASIGVFFLPITAALLVACATRTQPRSQSSQGGVRSIFR